MNSTSTDALRQKRNKTLSSCIVFFVKYDMRSKTIAEAKIVQFTDMNFS